VTVVKGTQTRDSDEFVPCSVDLIDDEGNLIATGLVEAASAAVVT
jgi:hypothetical protein